MEIFVLLQWFAEPEYSWKVPSFPKISQNSENFEKSFRKHILLWSIKFKLFWICEIFEKYYTFCKYSGSVNHCKSIKISTISQTYSNQESLSLSQGFLKIFRVGKVCFATCESTLVGTAFGYVTSAILRHFASASVCLSFIATQLHRADKLSVRFDAIYALSILSKSIIIIIINGW